MLPLLDTPLPSIYRDVDLEDDARFLVDFARVYNAFTGSSITLSYESLRALDRESAVRTAQAEAKRAGAVPHGTSEDHIRRMVEATRAHVRFIMSYRVEAIAHPVHLVRPREADTLAKASGQQLSHDLGWAAILAERLTMVEVPGDHFTMLTEHAPGVASLLARELDRSSARLPA